MKRFLNLAAAFLLCASAFAAEPCDYRTLGSNEVLDGDAFGGMAMKFESEIKLPKCVDQKDKNCNSNCYQAGKQINCNALDKTKEYCTVFVRSRASRSDVIIKSGYVKDLLDVENGPEIYCFENEKNFIMPTKMTSDRVNKIAGLKITRYLSEKTKTYGANPATDPSSCTKKKMGAATSTQSQSAH